MMRCVLVLCWSLQLGCAPSCYAVADTKAAAAYVSECEGYEDTHSCPDGDRIDEEHAIAYQECKR